MMLLVGNPRNPFAPVAHLTALLPRRRWSHPTALLRPGACSGLSRRAVTTKGTEWRGVATPPGFAPDTGGGYSGAMSDIDADTPSSWTTSPPFPGTARPSRPTSSGCAGSRGRCAASPAWSSRTSTASTSSPRSPPRPRHCRPSPSGCSTSTCRTAWWTPWPRWRRARHQAARGLRRDRPAGALVTQSRRTYAVTGLTCGHCAAAVRAELSALPGVTQRRRRPGRRRDVDRHRHQRRPSSTVADVETALDEAGDYRLAAV